MCVTAAISLYVYVGFNRNHTDDIICKYQDKVERVKTIQAVRHPLIRRCLDMASPKPGFELVSLADVPGGTGLGSSGAFTVGTLACLFPDWPAIDVARYAAIVDVGWQDQYACALGGVRVTTPRGSEPIDCDLTGLRLFDTGVRHKTSEVLAQNERPDQQTLLEQALVAREALEAGDFSFLSDQWEAKFAAAPTDTHKYVDRLIRGLGVPAKLVGSGNGGMILAWSPEPLRTPLREIPFGVDDRGVTFLSR